MTTLKNFENRDRGNGIWVSVTLKDGLIFEGLIQEETSYGIRMTIGGDPDRLNLFPWHMVSRLIYKQ